jgi:uncharacterized protein YecT (DUF1311 family)
VDQTARAGRSLEELTRVFRTAAIGAAALLGAAAFAFAGDQGDPDESCGVSTPEMVDCLGKQRDYWDKQMTAAYRELMKSSEGKQKEQLRAAQRLWIQYRDANCLYYAVGEGSIARVEAAECMRSMTQARAKELIGINTPGADKPGKEDRN